jgi:hypothetical protein
MWYFLVLQKRVKIDQKKQYSSFFGKIKTDVLERGQGNKETT